MTACIDVESLDVFYGTARALSEVSVSVGAGELVAVLGGNASGKSTLLRCILGLVPAAGGRISLKGCRIDGLDTREIVEMGVASVPEGRRLFPEMTVEENIQMGLYARRRLRAAASREALDEVLAMFPQLRDRRRQEAGTLSGGEQQMVALARAWIRRPEVLCIDEPSMGLSPLYVDRVYDVIRSWKRSGVTILMVEQSASRALEVADRAYILDSGRVVHQGQAAELAADTRVQHAYLGGAT